MKVNRNVMINKAGGSSGKTKENRSVTLELVNDEIIIKKANKE